MTDPHTELPLPASDHATSDAVPRDTCGNVDHGALQERALRPLLRAEQRAVEAEEERAEALIAECEARAGEEPEWQREGRRERQVERQLRAEDEAHFRRLER